MPLDVDVYPVIGEYFRLVLRDGETVIGEYERSKEAEIPDKREEIRRASDFLREQFLAHGPVRVRWDGGSRSKVVQDANGSLLVALPPEFWRFPKRRSDADPQRSDVASGSAPRSGAARSSGARSGAGRSTTARSGAAGMTAASRTTPRTTAAEPAGTASTEATGTRAGSPSSSPNRSRQVERVLGICPRCGMELLPSGTCGYCED